MPISLNTPRTPERGLFIAASCLALFGCVAMASAAATVNPRLALRHALWVALGMLLSLAVARTSFRRWADVSWIAYGACLIALALVPLAGVMRLGATRWLSIFGWSLQPSELAKLATTMVLAHVLAGQPAMLPTRAFWSSLALAGLPAVLIFLQPDLGSASVFGAIWLGMVWVAGSSRRQLAALGGALLMGLPIGWHLLKDYQRDRLLVFINPDADPLGAGYTIIQSTIAMGSGQLWGRGWFAGTQNQLNFLPERHSDFLFSVVGEEWGLLGCLGVVVGFGIMLALAVRIALRASMPQGRLFAAGVFSWIAYQAFVNMGMVIGLLPVVGVPLPMLSYGGSAMLSVWLALGLLESVRK